MAGMWMRSARRSVIRERGAGGLSSPASGNELVRQKLSHRPAGWQASCTSLQRLGGDTRLQAIQSFVQAASGEQLPMRSTLAHLPMMEDENLVGVDDRAQSVGDGDGRAALHEHRECALNLRFDLAVDGARRL